MVAPKKRRLPPGRAALTVLSVLGLSLTLSFFPAAAAPDFNDTSFATAWNRVDKPVQDLPAAGRGYTWGPVAPGAAAIRNEPYNGGFRRVQYFDKARMEVNNPAANPDDLYYVTTGLLVKELVTGARQDGDNTFSLLPPSTVQIAGDSNQGVANLIAPTYASFKAVGTWNGTENGQDSAPGALITAAIDKAGRTSTITPPEQQTIGGYDAVTRHNLAGVFSTFGAQTGQVWDGRRFVSGPVFFGNPTYVLGRPVTEPYWIRAVVAGVNRDVLVQLFERRVLTYTPANPEGFKVEMGNVGQHYYQWRYVLNGSLAASPAPPAFNPFPADFSQFRAAYHKSGPRPASPGSGPRTYNTGASGIYSSPALNPEQNVVVFGTDDKGVIALKLPEATLKWVYPAGPEPPVFKGTPLIYNGVVYIGANGGKLYALNLGDGSLRWSTSFVPPGSQLTGAPVTDGTNLYFTSGGNGEGYLFAASLADGSKVWQSKKAGAVTSGPIFGAGNHLYFGSADGRVYAYTTGGQEAADWSTPHLTTGITASPAYAGGVLYVATSGGTLYALGSTGAVLGSNALARSIYTTPAYAGGRVYVGTSDGLASRVVGVAAGNVAEVQFEFEAGAVVDSSVAVVDGYLYFGTAGRKFFQVEAANPLNQTVLFSAERFFGTNSAIVAGGRVYIGNPDGKFYIV